MIDGVLVGEVGDNGPLFGTSTLSCLGGRADAGVFSGGGIADGEKSRLLWGFAEVSLVVDGAKLAALACLTEYSLALSVGCACCGGTVVSTCSDGPGDRGGPGEVGKFEAENALRSSPRSKEFVRCNWGACADAGTGVVKLLACDEVAGCVRSSIADATSYSSSSS
jgi:hypothetical protein